MKSKTVGIVTPLALNSVPIEFHLSYLAYIQYLQMHAKELPFNLKEVRMIAPHTFPIDANRNECVAWAKKWDCNITVWFDADQDLMNCAFEEREADVLFRLLKDGYEYPVYAGIYYLKKPPFHPIIFKANENFDVFKPIWKMPESDLFYADMIGMGCCKIDKEVFIKLDKPYFKYNEIPQELAKTSDLIQFKYENGVGDVSEDVHFWRQVHNAGYKIIVDPKIQVGHITTANITKGVFGGHMEGNKELALKQLGEEKFNTYWESVCQAEIVKKND